LAKFKGVDISDDDADRELYDPDNELIDAFYAFEKEFHNQFLTTCGPVNGQVTITMLNNAAAMHEFTGVNSYNQQAQEKSHLFTFYSRYDANIFQGIMPDTGAAGVSTAGEPQVKVLQKGFPKVTVDTLTAGQHKIFFDDNSEILSLGTIGVEIPFGNVYFAVMPINTPFLFCLADMNRYNVYLNNINNVLIHNSKEHPIVRK
jgi:hypothetical protein